MKYIERIKRVLALVILACFFLPLCQCTTRMPVGNERGSLESSKTDVLVPFEQIHFQEADEMLLVALFVWPLVFWAARRGRQFKRKTVVLNSAELICSLASVVYLGLIFRFWGEPRYGGVIAIFAFFASAVFAAGVVLHCVLSKRV